MTNYAFIEKLNDIDIFSSLKQGHPRLLIGQGDVERVKNLLVVDSHVKRWYEVLNQEAEAILEGAVEKYYIPDGLRLLETSRRVVRKTYILGFMFLMNKDQKYIDRLWEELYASANFQDWNPRHFLDTGEMTHAFAIGYDWLYAYWNEQQRSILCNAIKEKGFKPYFEAFEEDMNWTHSDTNWNFVCNGGIGMGALAMADIEPDLANNILRLGFSRLPLALASYAPDGGWDEGPGYWNYGARYLGMYLAALDTALGTDYGFSQMPGISETCYFPMYVSGPSASCFAFGDSGFGRVSVAPMFWFARKFNKPVFSWWRREVASKDIWPLDLLWYEPNLCKTPLEAALPLDKYFRKVEVATFRSSWENPNGIFIGLRGRKNPEQHHTDLDHGCFVLEANGVWWGLDLGGENYMLPGFWDYSKNGGRWNYYRKRAEGQNTLVINPGFTPDQDPEGLTEIISYETATDGGFAVIDLTEVYAKHALIVVRGLALYDNREKILVQDEITLREAGEVWWFMHTRADIEISEDGRTAILSQEGQKLKAEIVGYKACGFEVMDAVPLASSPNPQGQNMNVGIRKLAIHIENIQQLNLGVIFTPNAEEQSIDKLVPPILPLKQWAKKGKNVILHKEI